MATHAVIPDSATGETLEIPSGGAERHEYMMTGKLPAPKEETKQEEVSTQADSSTAEDAPADSSTATDEQAEEVEAQPEEQVAKPHKKRGAEARIIELLEENKRLREAGTKETKAAPSPAPALLSKPKLSDFETMEAFEEANEKFNDQKIELAIQQAEFKRELNAKLGDARKRYEDFDAKAAPLVRSLTDGSIDKNVLDSIDDSPLFSDLLYAIGGEEANVKDFIDLAKSNPRAAIKRIGQLEQLISDELKGEADKAAQPRDDKGKFAADKKISKAPPPPTELGGTGGAPPDEMAAALERGDMTTYRRLADASDLARVRKG